ncbi:MAG: DNA-formamidopyrimidine glycosylase [Chloroflexi bacterium]|nr:DNA-formamidopyrimidine glycosylase [Chloroflexota bacterium]
MPELPEVEAFRRYLVAQGLVGRRINDAEVRWVKAVRSSSTLEAFLRDLRGRRISGIERRAKYLVVPLDSGALVLHLRMTGSLAITSTSEAEGPFVRTVIKFDDGRELRFADPRKLGQLWFVNDPAPLFEKLGPEPLLEDLSPNPSFSDGFLANVFRGRHAPIKSLLIDQRVAAGVGNIFADEALFAAGLHPRTPAGELTQSQIAGLRSAVVEVLAAAIRDLDGRAPIIRAPTPGPATDEDRTLRVPRRVGVACTTCGTPISKSDVGSRGTIPVLVASRRSSR